jgi:hypothetical protein
MAPHPQRQGRVQAAPADPSRSTLSIGTIEVTVLAPPPVPPPARTSGQAARLAPDRLSCGIGPRFGQGQT